MQAFFLLLSIPLMLLNAFGGLVGGIWLAIEGHWAVVLWGVGYMLVGALVNSLVLMPGMIFAMPALALLQGGRPIMGAIMAFPGILWTQAVLAVSCVAVFWLLTNMAGFESLWPSTLWGYGCALAPWAFLARKDQEAGNDSANTPLFFAGIGAICMGVATIVNGAPLQLGDALLSFLPAFGLGVLFQVLQLFVEAGRSHRMREYYGS